MSMLVAAQISAVATAVLALLALATSVFAALAFRTQSRQLKDQEELNQLQAAELRASLTRLETEIPALRREQAKRVLVWQTERLTTIRRARAGRTPGTRVKMTTTVHAHNTSALIVRNVVVHWYRSNRPAGDSDSLGDLHPGEETQAIRAYPAKALVYFSDDTSVRWQASSDGPQIEEIATDQAIPPDVWPYDAPRAN